jgi:dipeptidyl aminopeptidase/acylaminoacyl peptidase
MRASTFGLVSVLALMAAAGPALAQQAGAPPAYQQPPQPIAAILDSKPSPTPSLSPDRQTVALFDRSNLPSIEELAEPMLKLAGYRINPRNNGPANSRVSWLTGLSFQDVSGGPARVVQLPDGVRYTSPSWSPNGKSVAFLVDESEGMSLYVASTEGGAARRLTTARVNAATGNGFDWLPDGSGLLVRMTPANRGAAPDVTRPPTGPIVEETAGRAAPVRTYQDLLGSPGDEALFDHYFTSQLTLVGLDGTSRNVGGPGVILGASVSPDGRYVLQTRAKKPYSYVVPAGLFPAEVFVTDLQGRVVHGVADLPLRDDVPTPFDAVAPGRRSVQWRADADATLAWVEAQDGGDPRNAADRPERALLRHHLGRRGHGPGQQPVVQHPARDALDRRSVQSRSGPPAAGAELSGPVQRPRLPGHRARRAGPRPRPLRPRRPHRHGRRRRHAGGGVSLRLPDGPHDRPVRDRLALGAGRVRERDRLPGRRGPPRGHPARDADPAGQSVRARSGRGVADGPDGVP